MLDHSRLGGTNPRELRAASPWEAKRPNSHEKDRVVQTHITFDQTKSGKAGNPVPPPPATLPPPFFPEAAATDSAIDVGADGGILNGFGSWLRRARENMSTPGVALGRASAVLLGPVSAAANRASAGEHVSATAMTVSPKAANAKPYSANQGKKGF